MGDDVVNKEDEGGGGQGSIVESLSENKNNENHGIEEVINDDAVNTDSIPSETKECDQTTTSMMMDVVAAHDSVMTNKEKDDITTDDEIIGTMMPTESEIEASIAFENHHLEDEEEHQQSSIAPPAQLLQHGINEENRNNHEPENIMHANLIPQGSNNAAMKQVED